MVTDAPTRPAHTVALDGVSLTIAPGHRVGIVGESGSGKTTLLRVLAGLQRIGEGTVLYEGSPLDLRRRRQSSAVPAVGTASLPGPRELAGSSPQGLGARERAGVVIVAASVDQSGGRLPSACYRDWAFRPTTPTADHTS